MLSRAALAAVLVALVAAASGMTAPAYAASVAATAVVAPQDAVTAPPKIVIVVGATESVTSTYRSDADSIYATAIKYTPNVVKVYSPNATWAAVRAAAQGASVFIYLGHGYGFPSPYKAVLTPSVQDGMGLNTYLNQGDSDKTYYGESVVASGIRLAKNAIVILNHLCYSAGSSESGAPEPTIPVAKQRVDNFASGFLRTGARTVIADAYTGAVEEMLTALFTSHESMNTLWHGLISAHHHDITWTPLRNPAYTAIMDPDTTTTGFHRSIVGNLNLSTDDIIAGASAPKTSGDPSTLQAPGAAAVTTPALPVFTDSGLTAPTGATLASATKLRVSQLQPSALLPDGSTTPAAVDVTTLDGATSGWVTQAGVVPRDSVAPQLWAMDGATSISPNFDGLSDTLNLLARFSEPVSWTARLLDSSSTAVHIYSGTGDSAAIGWNPIVAGVVPPDGSYTGSIHADDGWGNVLDASGPFQIANAPVPPSGVLTFAPTTPTTTNAATLAYSLVFAGPVTGLAAADFTITGSSPGCVVGTPLGAGATYTVTVGSCATGKVVLTLEPGTVTDTLAGKGPGGAITAHWILVDRTAPTISAPKASLRSGSSLSGSALAAVLSWTAADTGGSGLASYDVLRSTDGGAFAVIGSALPGASLNLSLAPGHTYRFEVRARDGAANRSAWVAGPTLYPALVQQTSSSVVYAGSWTLSSSSLYSGGSARYASAAGASATYSFSGRSIGVVLSRGASRGQVKVYVDGVYATTVDLYSATNTYRSIAFSRTFSSSGAHTVKLVVVGTAGRPTVVLDAFALIR
jgi:hypothetical protein